MVNVRNKGQSGEREFAKLINDEFGSDLSRNLNQTQNGGYDLVTDHPELNMFAFEVKRCETLCIPMWWRQAVKQARKSNKIPVLAYRQSRKNWTILVPTYSKDSEDWDNHKLTYRFKDWEFFDYVRELNFEAKLTLESQE